MRICFIVGSNAAGSAWDKSFPSEVFFWTEPRSTVPIGGHSLGMIHKPTIGVQEALQRFVTSTSAEPSACRTRIGARPSNPI